MSRSAMVVRFPYPLRKADQRALKRLEREFHEIPVSGRIGPEGERQVRCLSGEVYNLEAVPKFQVRRMMARNGQGPNPPGGAAALRAA